MNDSKMNNSYHNVQNGKVVNVLQGEHPEMKIDHQNLNISDVNISFDQKIAAAISAGAGAYAGIQVAKHVTGSSFVKIASGIAIAGAVQLTTVFMDKILNTKK
jgi:hypothetical protein